MKGLAVGDVSFRSGVDCRMSICQRHTDVTRSEAVKGGWSSAVRWEAREPRAVVKKGIGIVESMYDVFC